MRSGNDLSLAVRGRAITRTSVIVAVVVGLVAPAGDGRPLRWRPRPNVLVIVSDDQRADTLLAMPKTRRSLADRGIRFVNNVVTTPLCCPSRATIYSGKYAHNHGVWDNQNTTGRLDTTETVQSVLKDEGYFTAHVDRYLNNWRAWTSAPRDFDLYAVQLGPSAWGPFEALVNGRRVHVADYTTDWIADEALGFATRFEAWDDTRPWLMFVTTRAPHVPATPERRYADAPVERFSPPPSFREDLSDKAWLEPFASARVEQIRRQRRDQMRSLRSIDDLVDRLVSSLEDLGELRDTLIVYTSDNGYFWGEHGLVGKRWPYDESLRVPLLLRWDAGGLLDGSTRRDLVANIDIAPTIYDAAGIAPPYPVDGRSLLSRARRRAILIEYREVVENPDVPSYLGLWSPGKVFLRFPEAGRSELYRRDDPWQLHNEYSDGRGPRTRRYLQRLRAWSRCVGDSCP